MNALLRALAISPLVMLLACEPVRDLSQQGAPTQEAQISPTATPFTFTSSAGNFSIWMPTTLEQNGDLVSQFFLEDTINCYVFFAREGGAYWLVEYCDLPESIMTKFGFSEILDSAREGLLNDARGKLLIERPISISGDPGRHIEAASALRDPYHTYDGTYHARIYLVGNRLYKIATYVFNENWNNRLQQIDDFLESFQLLSDGTYLPATPWSRSPGPQCISTRRVAKSVQFKGGCEGPLFIPMVC